MDFSLTPDLGPPALPVPLALILSVSAVLIGFASILLARSARKDIHSGVEPVPPPWQRLLGHGKLLVAWVGYVLAGTLAAGIVLNLQR
jgi:hypothetical protein